MAKRYDKAQIGRAEITPQGFLRAPATFSRAGVLKYIRNGQMVRELRLPEEISKAESLSTLQGVPLTNNHPKKLLDPETVKEHMVGAVGESVEMREGKFIDGHITVMDASSIQDVQAGKVELSAGYDADMELSSGEYEGEPYDCIQRNIIYNHVSLVDKGRAGAIARVHLDSTDAIEYDEEAQMEKILINGQEFEVSPALKAALEAMMAKTKGEMDSMQAEIKGAKDDAEKLDTEQAKKKAEEEEKGNKDEKGEEEKDAKMDAMQAKIDALEAKQGDESGFNQRYAERRAVERVADSVLKEVKLDGMSNQEIKLQVLKEKTGTDFSKKSEAYVSARFDLLEEELVKTEKVEAEKISTFGSRLDASDENSSAAARKRMVEEGRNAWKQ